MSKKQEAPAEGDKSFPKLSKEIEEYIDGEIRILRQAGLSGDLDVMAERALTRLNRRHDELREVEAELELVEYDIKQKDKVIESWCKPQRKLLSRLLVLIFKIRKPFDKYHDEYDELKQKRTNLIAARDSLMDKIDEDTDLAKRAAACRRAITL